MEANKSLTIFQRLQSDAIKWGKQYLIAHVGDIVEVPTKRGTQKVMITGISVGMGRNSRITCKKSFYLDYSGRRINKKGEFKDCIGTGICLSKFKTKEGKEFDISVFGINDIVNDGGLSFTIERDPEIVKQYPNCEYSDYFKFDYPYSY